MSIAVNPVYLSHSLNESDNFGVRSVAAGGINSLRLSHAMCIEMEWCNGGGDLGVERAMQDMSGGDAAQIVMKTIRAMETLCHEDGRLGAIGAAKKRA